MIVVTITNVNLLQGLFLLKEKALHHLKVQIHLSITQFLKEERYQKFLSLQMTIKIKIRR